MLFYRYSFIVRLKNINNTIIGAKITREHINIYPITFVQFEHYTVKVRLLCKKKEENYYIRQYILIHIYIYITLTIVICFKLTRKLYTLMYF